MAYERGILGPSGFDCRAAQVVSRKRNRYALADRGYNSEAMMDLVGGEMTDRFIDSMIFDMKRRTSYHA